MTLLLTRRQKAQRAQCGVWTASDDSKLKYFLVDFFVIIPPADSVVVATVAQPSRKYSI